MFFYFAGNLKAQHKDYFSWYCWCVCLLGLTCLSLQIETERPKADPVGRRHDSLEQITICCSAAAARYIPRYLKVLSIVF